MLNFLGATASFSLVAGLPWTATLRFFDEVSGEADELTGVTFRGWVDAKGTRYELRCVRTEGVRNEVVLEVPALPEGRWPFEVSATAETGEVTRLLYGHCTAVGQEYKDDGTAYDGRTLDVLLPGDAQRRLRLEWRASTMAQLAAQEAKRTADGVQDVAEGALEALHAAQEAVRELDGVQDAVGAANELKETADATKREIERMLEEAPREYVPTIVNGTWWVNGVDLGKPATGKDGADGVTLVRHAVESYADIPQSGETCNGGHLYYVRSELRAATGWVSFDFAPMADIGLYINGVHITTRYDGEGVSAWCAAINAANCGVTAEEYYDGATLRVVLTAVTPGAAGNSITLTCEEGRRRSGDTLTGGIGEDGWDVYAWLEGAGWQKVAHDGTIVRPSDLPVASYIQSGTVTLGTATLCNDGYPVAVGSDGRMRVDIPRASNSRFGLIKLGSYIVEIQRQPYIVGIGATGDGQLANNLLLGGALKHMRRDAWLSADPRIDPAVFPDGGAYCMGLHISRAFTQSEEVGLDLAPATTTHRGGVQFTTDPHDAREGMVLTTAALLERFLSREELERALLEVLSGYIRTNGTLNAIQVLTREQYDALEHIEARTLYIV